MHEPKRIKATSLADYLEVMSKSVFQTGISWNVVEAKWPGIREAFREFDPVAVSRLTMADIDALVQNKNVIRNRRKIEAIIGNALRLLELDSQYGGFRKYLRSFDSYEELTKDLRKQFKYLGDMGIYRFLWVVGEEVPAWEGWGPQHMATMRH